MTTRRMVRKPVSASPPLTAEERESIDLAIETIDLTIGPMDSVDEPIESHIKDVRGSNPNLQPLLAKHELNTRREQRPTSFDLKATTMKTTMSPSPPPSSFRHSVGASFDRGHHQLQRQVERRVQPFWKYHVLQFGNNLYLSTNPTSKHLLCRHSQGLHTEIRYKEDGKEFEMLLLPRAANVVKGKDFIIVNEIIDDTTSEGGFRYRRSVAQAVPQQPLAEGFQPVKYVIRPEGYTLGSLPKTKNGKLKDKRYLYFQHENEILAVFRPHELRWKKRMISKLNKHSSAKEVIYDSNELADDTTYYAPGDGLSQRNPQDDCPNSDKLGWITIFDNPFLEEKGNWEMVVSMTLALGYARTTEER